jgi:hypothetical protein
MDTHASMLKELLDAGEISEYELQLAMASDTTPAPLVLSTPVERKSGKKASVSARNQVLPAATTVATPALAVTVEKRSTGPAATLKRVLTNVHKAPPTVHPGKKGKPGGVTARHVIFSPTAAGPDIPDSDRRLRLVLESVSKGSQRQYLSGLRQLGRFVLASKKQSFAKMDDPGLLAVCAGCNEADFFAFLDARKHQQCAQAETHRSALIMLQLGLNLEPFAQSPAIQKATKAIKLAARDFKIDKGCVTPDMFEQLMDLTEDRQTWCAFGIAFVAALRVNELQLLRVGDLQPNTSVNLSLTLRSNKSGKEKVTNKTVPLDIEPYWEAACKGRKKGELLFKEEKGKLCIAKKMQETLRTASDELDWPSGLAWGGTHCLRIGGDAEIQRRVHETLCTFAARQAPSTFKMYTTPNSQRKRARS